MRIGELATRTGVSVRSLRYYEEQGLLSAQRSPSGQRHYGARAVDRVQLIQQLYGAGLPSKSIREVLPCAATGEATPELIAWLAGERDRIDQQIGDLKDTRDRLDDIISTATTALRTGRPCTVS
ncbi:MerR family transcriptional regulator [Streptomyces sp. MNP-20]|uniref:MerR family transcriptional regulator n=1 Tax=Streptomyces sp. MNP-20 TaxID=2721165 RepID=UPI0015555CA8|nr:MerR family transcriptional regulator [Streptomyces sp. MNP-20]